MAWCRGQEVGLLLPPNHFVTLGKSLNLLKPRFLQLQNRNYTTSEALGEITSGLCGLTNIMYIGYRIQ